MLSKIVGNPFFEVLKQKVAGLIGLEKFLRVATARSFINEFTLWHLRQLDKINMGIFKDFGEATFFVFGNVKPLERIKK